MKVEHTIVLRVVGVLLKLYALMLSYGAITPDSSRYSPVPL